jgi:hypothetical protein
MSHRVQGIVWERSRAKGSELLVLLKIADFANDEGFDAFPTSRTLAKWARMSERGVRHILHRLERAGEIIIEQNAAARSLTIGKRSIRPEWFIHVRCVSDAASYQQGRGAFVSAPFRPGRPVGPRPAPSPKPEILSDSAAEQTGKVVRETGQDFPEAGQLFRETGQIASRIIRKDPLGDPRRDPVRDPSAGAAPQPPPVENPADNLGSITKLAHETCDLLVEDSDFVDLVEGLKARCAQLRIAYDGEVITSAIESALYQRRRAGRFVPAKCQGTAGDVAAQQRRHA